MIGDSCCRYMFPEEFVWWSTCRQRAAIPCADPATHRSKRPPGPSRSQFQYCFGCVILMVRRATAWALGVGTTPPTLCRLA
ncbi:hypothetical protein BD310DRAFT_914939 [Dichomitus squalens]|uniref:Uncharacterized protein n=1 Tax=Dichomitus squalens TaxID=114155 RepID=A0A4Q9QD01_9APHY|nr:hypothetical protein BD310DRAFT_914939 [Dichomitus squalens]